jgi:hypothetical protein
MRYGCTKWVITVSRSLGGIALLFPVLAASLLGGLRQFPPSLNDLDLFALTNSPQALPRLLLLRSVNELIILIALIRNQPFL